MKSIRYALLKCLKDHGEQTMDDLELQLVDFQKNKIYSNLQAAKSEQLVSMRPDDVTRRPAYKITAKGKAWLSEKGETKAADDPEASNDELAPANQSVIAVEPVKDSLTTDAGVPVITVTIAGPVGTGKTAIARELDKALANVGTTARFDDEAECMEARHLALGNLNPISAQVVIAIENGHPPCCGAARVMATTAAEVSGEYRAQMGLLTEQNRLLSAENSALRAHSLMLGQIAEVSEQYQQLGDATTLDVVTAMVSRITDLESAVDLSQQTIHQQELEAEQNKERIATLEVNGDLLANPIESDELAGWRELASLHGCANPESLGIVVKVRTREMDRLKVENTALKTLNEAMPGFGAAYEANRADKKPPFYVSIGRDTGPQIHKDIEVAIRRMKSIVRRGDEAALVLVPILKAIKGVEVVEVKSA